MLFLNSIESYHRLFIIFLFYSIFGILIHTILNGEVFLFLFSNGFDKILHYIFVGNNEKLHFHIAKADESFLNRLPQANQLKLTLHIEALTSDLLT